MDFSIIKISKTQYVRFKNVTFHTSRILNIIYAYGAGVGEGDG